MEAKSIETQSSDSLPLNQQGLETLLILDVAFLAVISLGMFLTILFQRDHDNIAPIYDCIPKQRQHLFSLKPRHKLSCRRCRYFSSNPYLKCALHPVTVLTKQAVNCADYDLRREVKQFKE